MGCQQPGEPEAEPRRWQLGVAWAGFDTDLRFEDGYAPSLRQHATTVSGTRLFDRGWSLRLAAGASLGGSLGTNTLGPGWQVAVQGAKRWRAADGAKPFVTTSLAAAVGSAPVAVPSAAGSLLGTDLRLGAAVGWQLGAVWSPYLAVQLFGGPAFLSYLDQRTMGSDLHHYRPSVGSTFFLGDALSLFVDLAPVGESGVAAGVSYAL